MNAAAVVCAVDDLRGGGGVVATAGRLAERLGAGLVLLHGEPALLEAEPQVAYAAGGARSAAGTGLAPAGRGLARLAAASGAAGLVAVHVARSAGNLGAGGRLLERALDEEGLDDADRRVVAGTPAHRLADLADEEGGELVAVGSRGRGALRAAFLGSVSAGLVAARRPVLVVPRYSS